MLLKKGRSVQRDGERMGQTHSSSAMQGEPDFHGEICFLSAAEAARMDQSQQRGRSENFCIEVSSPPWYFSGHEQVMNVCSRLNLQNSLEM